MYCLDYLESNLDWLQEKLEAIQKGFIFAASRLIPALSDSISTECHAALPVQVRIRMSCLTYQAK